LLHVTWRDLFIILKRSVQRSAYTAARESAATDHQKANRKVLLFSRAVCEGGAVVGDEATEGDLKTGKNKGVVLVREIIIFFVSPSTCSSLM
jgi:hypothetical protein